MKETAQGNPKAENMFGSGDSGFFDALESDVNGAIQEGTPQEKPQTQATKQPATNPAPASPENKVNSVDWQKRYQDSSREAQRLGREVKDLKPFLPVLNAMRQDSGLVDHVRNYLVNGGQPTKGVAGGLSLPEDFQFDANELADPNSDSAKVLDAQINEAVTRRVSGMMAREKQKAGMAQKANILKAHEDDFKHRHKMSQADFDILKEQANKHILTLDDVYYILNKDKQATNVANSTKENMIKQMNTVNSMPGTQAATNSQGEAEKSPDSDLFDTLLGVDQNRDNLFG